jgi:hypothetical protein
MRAAFAEFSSRFNQGDDPVSMLARIAIAVAQTLAIPHRFAKLAEVHNHI